jgi:hypothetical protein
LAPTSETRQLTCPHPSCEGMIYSIFQRNPMPAVTNGFVVALVGAHEDAGTTHVTRLLANSLNCDSPAAALAVNYQELVELSVDSRMGSPTSAMNSNMARDSRGRHEKWRGSRSYRTECIRQIRGRFGYLLIDCPSIRQNAEVLAIAPLVDGLLLVVEANRTGKRQVAYLERTIESAGGKILGHILNKRTYPVPRWLFKWIN